MHLQTIIRDIPALPHGRVKTGQASRRGRSPTLSRIELRRIVSEMID